MKQTKTALQSSVMKLLEWDEMEYYLNVYERGLEYLDEYVTDAHLRKRISHTTTYWMWWKRQWQLRDLQWLSKWGDATQRTLSYRRRAYRLKHKLERMEVYPSRVVKRLIQDELNKKLTVKA